MQITAEEERALLRCDHTPVLSLSHCGKTPNRDSGRAYLSPCGYDAREPNIPTGSLKMTVNYYVQRFGQIISLWD